MHFYNVFIVVTYSGFTLTGYGSPFVFMTTLTSPKILASDAWHGTTLVSALGFYVASI